MRSLRSDEDTRKLQTRKAEWLIWTDWNEVISGMIRIVIYYFGWCIFTAFVIELSYSGHPSVLRGEVSVNETRMWTGLAVMHLSGVLGYAVFRVLLARGRSTRIWLYGVIGFATCLLLLVLSSVICAAAMQRN